MIDDSRISESTVSYAVRVSNRDSHSTDFFFSFYFFGSADLEY